MELSISLRDMEVPFFEEKCHTVQENRIFSTCKACYRLSLLNSVQILPVYCNVLTVTCYMTLGVKRLECAVCILSYTLSMNVIPRTLITYPYHCLVFAFLFCLKAVDIKVTTRKAIYKIKFEIASKWYVAKFRWVLLVTSLNVVTKKFLAIFS